MRQLGSLLSAESTSAKMLALVEHRSLQLRPVSYVVFCLYNIVLNKRNPLTEDYCCKILPRVGNVHRQSNSDGELRLFMFIIEHR